MNAKSRKFETRLTVSLTEKDYDALNALADKDDVSASWLIRRAVDEYLRQRHKEIPPAGTERARGERLTAQRRPVHRRKVEC